MNHWVIPRYGILPRLLANETAVFQQFAVVGIVDWPRAHQCGGSFHSRSSYPRLLYIGAMGLQYESNYPYARYRYIMSVWIARP